MRFCGVELTSVHPAVSVAKEIRPGMPTREVITVAGADGETLVGRRINQGEYRVRVNIAGKSKKEAWEALAAVAAWANASGEKTGVLEPTHWPGKAYDAIVSDIEAPEFAFGFATAEIVFVLPRPYAYDMIQSTASGTEEAVMHVGGTATARPVVEITTGDMQGLTVRVDDKPAILLMGEYKAGQTVTVDFARGEVSLDGNPEEHNLNIDNTRWRPGFVPGRHVVQCPGAQTLTVRWRNEWM